MLSAQFDHAVIIAPSLEPAVRSFERLGFHVVKGGRTGPVHNALILFADGTYLEITTNRFSALRPLFRGLHTVGLIDKFYACALAAPFHGATPLCRGSEAATNHGQCTSL